MSTAFASAAAGGAGPFRRKNRKIRYFFDPVCFLCTISAEKFIGNDDFAVLHGIPPLSFDKAITLVLYYPYKTFGSPENICLPKRGAVTAMDTRDIRLDYENILMVKTAWYYYMENYTQQNISHLLGISRAKVINLLEKARQSGVIQFNIRQDGDRRMKLEQDLISRFGLSDVFTVPTGSTLSDLNESIAQAAAMYIIKRSDEGAFINMGYGDTTSRILNHLAMTAEKPLNMVSLTGGVNYYLPNAYSNVFNARLYLIPSPLLLSSPEIRNALRQEPSVQEVYRMIPLSSMSVVGIGSMSDDATMIKNGILSKNDLTVLTLQGAVGDILSHFLDKNGEPISVDQEQRLMSTPLDDLRKLEHVIGAAGGPCKVDAILAALRGGYLDVLVTDEGTAEALLQRAGA